MNGILVAEDDLEATRLRLTQIGERPGLLALDDLNFDGGLNRRELAELSKRLTVITGESGQLARDKVPTTIVVVLERGPFGTAPTNNPLGPPGPPWFLQTDTNQDGDLDREEFPGSLDDFERLDVNKDGWIEVDEAIIGAEVEVTIPKK